MVLLAAAALRIRGIGWGLPGLTEEATPYRKALEFWGVDTGRVGFDPHFFNYPSLTFYLHFLVQAVYGLVGWATGAWHSLAAFRNAMATSPASFILLARSVNVTIALFTIVPVFLTGRRLGGAAGGAAAACLLAVNPLHAGQSRFIGTDIPLAFGVAMALYYLVRIAEASGSEERRGGDWRRAGLWIGLAASCKYPGALLLVPLLGLFVVGKRGALVPALLTALLAFAITSPFVILDLPEAVHAVAFERYHMMTGHFGGSGKPAIVAWFTDILPYSFGWPGLVLAIVGLLLALVKRGPARVVAVVALTGLVVMGSWKVAADRYLLLVVPALVMMAGALVVPWAASRITQNRAVVPAAAALALLVGSPGIITAWVDGTLRALPTTRNAASRWLLASASRKTLIAAENYSVDGLPDSLSLLVIPFDAVHPHIYDPAYSLPYYAPFEYVVVSSTQYTRYLDRSAEYPAQTAFYEGVARDFDQVALFEPGRKLTGPTIRIFRRKPGSSMSDFRNISGTFYNNVPEKLPFARFLTSLAAVLEQGGKGDLAVAAAEEAVTLAPEDPKSLTNMAALHAARGDYLTALKTYQRALDVAPKDAVLHYNLGRLYQGKDLYSEAAASFVRAMEYNPRMPEPYLSLAVCQVRMNDVKAARETLRRFLELFPGHPRAPEAREALRELS